MKRKSPVKVLGPVLAYPFQITDLKPVRRRIATRRHGRKRPFPGVKVRMMDFFVEELRACAEALGWRFDAFLHHALLQVRDLEWIGEDRVKVFDRRLVLHAALRWSFGCAARARGRDTGGTCCSSKAGRAPIRQCMCASETFTRTLPDRSLMTLQ